MKNHLRITAVALLATFLAGCQGPCQKLTAIESPNKLSGHGMTSGSLDFTHYVAVGTSISAGWQSGGLVNRHQITSFPAVFAQQVGKTLLANGQGSFTFPAIGGDGIPPLSKIQSLSPLVIDSTGQTRGSLLNSQSGAYHNLGVPGAIALDFGSTAGYNSDDFRTLMFGLIAHRTDLGAVGNQMLSLAPTFVSFEYGSNEVLGPATSGVGSAYMPYTAATYATILAQSIGAIHAAAPNAKLALFNVPDVASLPFFTTFPPATISLTLGTPVSLLGPNGPLGSGDLITLAAGPLLAAGHGFPLNSYNYVNPTAPGLGDSLPDGVVLDSNERSGLATAITAMNATIDSIATANPQWIATVDLNGLLANVAANGYPLGSTLYTSEYLTGGLFSLDGVHPNDLGHAIIANTMIDAVNLRFGSTIPRVNLTHYATLTASSARPANPGSGSPFLPYARVQTNFERLFARHR